MLFLFSLIVLTASADLLEAASPVSLSTPAPAAEQTSLGPYRLDENQRARLQSYAVTFDAEDRRIAEDLYARGFTAEDMIFGFHLVQRFGARRGQLLDLLVLGRTNFDPALLEDYLRDFKPGDSLTEFYNASREDPRIEAGKWISLTVFLLGGAALTYTLTTVKDDHLSAGQIAGIALSSSAMEYGFVGALVFSIIDLLDTGYLPPGQLEGRTIKSLERSAGY
jgi:hypothetical protein